MLFNNLVLCAVMQFNSGKSMRQNVSIKGTGGVNSVVKPFAEFHIVHKGFLIFKFDYH